METPTADTRPSGEADDRRYLPQVELHQAFSWVCDICGQDHFERAVTIEPEAWDDRMREVAEAAGDQGGRFLTAPSEVVCTKCGRRYRTIDGD